MSVQTPEEWPCQFTQHLNAGNLAAVVKLYEPDARFVAPSDETLIGRDRISGVLAGLIHAKAQLHCQVRRTVTVGEIALVYTDFRGTTVESSDEKVEIGHKAIEVLRRQADGTWKLIVGDPQGRD